MPPSGEYLSAFESRFPTTWLTRLRSAWISSGSSGTLDPELVTSELALERRGLLVEQLAQVDFFQLQLEPRLLERAQVQEVADERLEPARLVGDDPEVAHAILVGNLPRQQRLREAEDARQRRPQLV